MKKYLKHVDFSWLPVVITFALAMIAVISVRVNHLEILLAPVPPINTHSVKQQGHAQASQSLLAQANGILMVNQRRTMA